MNLLVYSFVLFKHEAEYEEILSGAKGNPSERRLASQFISKFYEFFPNLQEQGLNSLFDLCEDADISVTIGWT